MTSTIDMPAVSYDPPVGWAQPNWTAEFKRWWDTVPEMNGQLDVARAFLAGQFSVALRAATARTAGPHVHNEGDPLPFGWATPPPASTPSAGVGLRAALKRAAEALRTCVVPTVPLAAMREFGLKEAVAAETVLAADPAPGETGGATLTPTQEAALIAQRFHEAYERLAPSFSYETRKESAKPWADVPSNNKALMTAVAAELMSGGLYLAPPPMTPDSAALRWQPIKTAPKDGTHVILAFGQDHSAEGWWIAEKPIHPWAFIDIGDKAPFINHARGDKYGPTHWQPMPYRMPRNLPQVALVPPVTAPARDGEEG